MATHADDDMKDDCELDEQSVAAVLETAKEEAAEATEGAGMAEGVGAGPQTEPASSASMPEYLVCIVCTKAPRADRQTWCGDCGVDVKCAERDAERRSGIEKKKGEKMQVPPESHLARFRTLKKRGGAEFREAVLVYKMKCQGRGRGYARPSFDWCRYFLAVEVASRMQAGSKCLWMSEKQFEAYMKHSEGMSEYEAAVEWKARLNVPKARTDKQGRLLIKVEDFIVTMNEKSHVERTEWGTKDTKNPTDGDIHAMEQCMGTDHRNFDNEAYKELAGFSGGFDGFAEPIFGLDTENHGPRPSADSLSPGKPPAGVGSGLADTSPGKPSPSGHIAPQSQKRVQSSLPAAQQPAKKRQKDFDASAVMSTLQPDLKDMVSKAKGKIEETIAGSKSCTELVKAAAQAHKEALSQANELLTMRTECLEAVMG